MNRYDIHNPSRTTRIFHDGIAGSQKPIRVSPGQTVCGVLLGDTTVRMIQSRQNHLKLALVGEGFPESAAPPPRPQPRTAPSRRSAAPVTLPHAPVKTAAPDEVAVVIGGAEGVWDEWRQAKQMCEEAGARPITFVVNDSIPLFPDHIDHAVTLHPDKYEREWCGARAAHHRAAAGTVWAHRRHKVVNKDTPDWGGSSGLFAIKIAMELGHSKILLCGVPMTVEGSHVIRKAPWRACDQFRKAWERHRREITPCVRSFSGWTKINFGSPSVAFIANGLAPRVGPEHQAGRVAEPVD